MKKKIRVIRIIVIALVTVPMFILTGCASRSKVMAAFFRMYINE